MTKPRSSIALPQRKNFGISVRKQYGDLDSHAFYFVQLSTFIGTLPYLFREELDFRKRHACLDWVKPLETNHSIIVACDSQYIVACDMNSGIAFFISHGIWHATSRVIVSGIGPLNMKIDDFGYLGINFSSLRQY